MRNENDTYPVPRQAPYEVHQNHRIALAEYRRWFVQDKNPCLRNQCLGDLGCLLMGNTESLHRNVNWEVHTQAPQDLGRVPSQCIPVYETMTGGVLTDKNVFRDGEMRGERQFLMDYVDTCT